MPPEVCENFCTIYTHHVFFGFIYPPESYGGFLNYHIGLFAVPQPLMFYISLVSRSRWRAKVACLDIDITTRTGVFLLFSALSHILIGVPAGFSSRSR